MMRRELPLRALPSMLTIHPPAVFALAEPGAAAAPASGIQPELWHWVAFGAFVVTMLVLDLGVFHRHEREPSLRESAFWTVVWAALALGFNGLVWFWGGTTAGIQFLTGYLVEWSLSMENVFVFGVAFGLFRVAVEYIYCVCFWWILGVLGWGV